jgi:fermentation-respiration switch protein FrsA (DUF1100 family)
MREQVIRFSSKGTDLAGTLTLPDGDGPFPAVLFLAGSGQVDRDENAKNIRLNAFFDISHFLAQNGFASLRYDKRGVGESGGDYWSTGFLDHAEDAQAGLSFLQRQPGLRPGKIFLLGHSEGAFLAIRLAGSGAPAAGVILIAGGARSGEAILIWQGVQVARGLRGINGWIIRTFHIDVQKAQQKQLDSIKRSTADVVRRNFVKINAKWLREFMAYDPSVDLPNISVPVLAVTGSKDIQVDPADLERMAQLVKAPFESRLIPDMTHLLRPEEGEPAVSKYREEVLKPIDPRLLETVLRWLQKQAA